MKATTLILGIALGVCAPSVSFAEQCVPYARDISGIELRGNAFRWWAAAAGRYHRGTSPQVGAVMVFKPVGRMRNGHLAVVRSVVSSREIRIDHANWPRNSGVTLNERVVDVSPRNDWSQVRVASGARVNPLHGFIYADPRQGFEPRIMEASLPTVTIISSATVRRVPVSREALAPASIAAPAPTAMAAAPEKPVVMAAVAPAPAPAAAVIAPAAARPALASSKVTTTVSLPSSTAAARLNAAVLARLRGVSPDQVLQATPPKSRT